MWHGAGLIVMIFTAGLMGVGLWLIRRMVNIHV
jgi:Flp pilus assembly protein TadB